MKNIIAAIIPEVGSKDSLSGPDVSPSQLSLMGIRSSLIHIVDSRTKHINSSLSKKRLNLRLSDTPLVRSKEPGEEERPSSSPQQVNNEYDGTGEMFNKPPPRVPMPSLAGDIVPSVKQEKHFSEPEDHAKLQVEPVNASEKVKTEVGQVVHEGSRRDSGMPENISEYVVPGHALLPQSRPDVVPHHGKQQMPSTSFNRRFTLPIANNPEIADSLAVSSRSPSMGSRQPQNAESDHASSQVSSTSYNMQNEDRASVKTGKLTADEWMSKEVKYKKRLSAAMATNVKTKMELLEKEKDLKFAEHEIGMLRKRVREMEHLVAENELKWRKGDVTISEGSERLSQNITSPFSKRINEL